MKLESYRDIEKSGKPLNEDQKTALSKFDVVAQTLDFVREISKQIAPIAAGAEKEIKKKQKKVTQIFLKINFQRKVTFCMYKFN